MRVLIFSAFDPVPYSAEAPMRYSMLAEVFLKHGHQLTYVSASWSHLHKQQRTAANTPAALDIILLPARPYYNNKSLGRVLSHNRLAGAMGRWLRQLSEEKYPDLVIGATPPVMTSFVMAKFCNRHHIPFVLDIQDLWPHEFMRFFPAKWMGKALLSPYFYRASKTIKRAAAITAVSEDYLNHYSQIIGTKPHSCFRLGADVENFAPPFAGRQPGKTINIIMLGNSQGGSHLMTAARAVQHIPGAQLTVAGLKEASDMFLKKVEKEHLRGIKIIPWMLPEEMYKTLPGYDAALVLVDSETKSAFPNRAFTYIAAGLPVVNNIRNGELEKCILENNLGISVDAEPDNIKAAIEYCVTRFPASEHQRIQEFGKNNFNRAIICEDFYQWVMQRVISKS